MLIAEGDLPLSETPGTNRQPASVLIVCCRGSRSSLIVRNRDQIPMAVDLSPAVPFKIALAPGHPQRVMLAPLHSRHQARALHVILAHQGMSQPPAESTRRVLRAPARPDTAHRAPALSAPPVLQSPFQFPATLPYARQKQLSSPHHGDKADPRTPYRAML